MRVFFKKTCNKQVSLLKPHKVSMPRILIAALGNPGALYKKHRHNAGSIILTEILATPFLTNLELEHKCIIESIYNFSEMNTSGEKLKVLMSKTQYDLLIVLVDDLETELSKMKQVYPTMGHKGQNGIRNIIQHLGNEFFTIRIGIGRPPGNTPVNEFVLSNFSTSEMHEILETIENVKSSIRQIILDVIKSQNE